MLLSFLIWGYIFIISFIYGFAFIKVISFLLKREYNIINEGCDIVSLAGICLLIILLSFFSLFINVGVEVHFIILMSAVIIALKFRMQLKAIFINYILLLVNKNKFLKGIYFLIFMIGLFYAVIPIYDPDTAYYHAQIIQWIEKFKVVPGLGNINPVFGYNQSIYLVSAFFSFSFLGIEPFHLINPYLFLLLITRLTYLIFEKKENCFFAGAILVFFLFTFYHFVSSCGTDLPAYVFCTYIILIFIQLNQNRFDLKLKNILIFLFTIIVLTIKLSVLPIVIISAFLTIKNIKKTRRKVKLIFFALLILILTPWITRNVILTGYLVYPLSSIDIFNVDWKIPNERVDIQKNFIKSWAIMPFEKEFPKKNSNNKSLSMLEWEERVNKQYINLDFNQKVDNILKRNKSSKSSGYKIEFFMSILACFTALFAPVFLGFKKKFTIVFTDVVLWGIYFFGIIYVVIFSPSYRFGCFFFLLSIICFVNILIRGFFKTGLSYYIRKILFLGIIVFSTWIGLKNYTHIKTIGINQYPYYKIKTKAYENSNMVVRVPISLNFCCWNTMIPCVALPGDLKEFEFRGDDLGSGFRPKDNIKAN
jgi:hypothetical protein